MNFSCPIKSEERSHHVNGIVEMWRCCLSTQYCFHIESFSFHSTRSSLVESILVSAQCVKRGSFRVIVVDSRPEVEGRQLADTLSAEGVPCTYVLLTAISYIMRVRNIENSILLFSIFRSRLRCFPPRNGLQGDLQYAVLIPMV